MARKKTTSRPNLPAETLRRARREITGQDVAVPEARPKKKRDTPPDVDTTVRKITMEDLASEYAYVATDLRNMGLLAGALFIFLIILSFVL